MKRISTILVFLTLLAAVCAHGQGQGNKVGSVSIGSQSGAFCAIGTTFPIQVQRASGASGAFSVDLSITSSLPAGVTASFSPNPLQFTNNTLVPSASATLTFSGVPVNAGSLSFTVKALRAETTTDFQTSNATLVLGSGLSITTHPSHQIVCDGQTATFTAAAASSPTPATVQWEMRTSPTGTWSDVSGATSTTLSFTAGTSQMGQHYRARFSNGCLTTWSGSAALGVNPIVPAGVSIAANPGTTIAAGTNVTFTATPVNGGGSPSYQWKLNGTNVGTNSDTYSNSTLLWGDQVNCEMTSLVPCVTNNPATSNTLTMQVNLALTAPAAGATLCAGAPMNITWAGGDPSWNVYLSLVDNATNAAVQTIATSTANDGSETWSIPNTLPAGSYRVYIQKVGDIQYYAHGGNFTLNTPPAVSSQPVSLTVCEGQTAAFTVAASGTPAPSIQWQISSNNGASWSDLAGETGTTLTFASAAVSQNGHLYHAVLTNSCSSTVSSAAILTVQSTQPVSVGITANPGTTVCDGTSITFTATPANGGTTPAYQWKLNGTDITGATSATYTSTTLAHNDAVACVLTSNAPCATGSPATSNTLTMTVHPNLPASVTIAANPGTSFAYGTNVTFTATPVNGGSAPSYQWKLNGTSVGTNNTTYANSALVYGDQVTCEMTSNATCATGSPALSNTLTMDVNFKVTAPAAGASLCAGSSTTITWAGGDPSWNVYLSLVDNATNAAVQTIATSTANDGSETWSIPNTLPAGSYHVYIQKVGDIQYYAHGGNFSIRTLPTVTLQPQNVTLCAGSTASFTVAASGSPAPTVQWESSSDGGQTWDIISGATNLSYSFSASTLQTGHQYRAALTNSCGSATSNVATLTVQTPHAITQQPASSVVCPGATASITVGTSGTVSYVEWSHNGNSLPTTPTGTLVINGFGASNAGTYVARVHGPCSGNVYTSNAAQLFLGIAPTISSHPQNESACVGSTASFSVSSSGYPGPTVQWQESADFGQTWSNIPGATNSTLNFTVAASQHGYQYRAVLLNMCGTVASNAASLTVHTPITITQQPSSATVCPGNTATLTIGLSGDVSYVQWYFNNSPYTSTSGGTLTISGFAASNAGMYRAVVHGWCGSVQTNPADLTFGSSPVVSSHPQNEIACDGASASFTAYAVSLAPTPTQQWQQSTNSGQSWTDIVGATGSTLGFTASIAQQGYQYRTVFTNSCGTTTSNAATLTVRTAHSITQQPADGSVCPGGTVTLTVGTAGTVSHYQWFFGGNLIATTGTGTLVINNFGPSNVGTYHALVHGPCGPSVQSNFAQLTLATPVQISAAPSDASACPGETITFSVTASGTSPSYQWYKGNTPIAGATTSSFTINGISAADQAMYYVRVANACTTVVAQASLVVFVPPQITVQPVSATLCSGTNAVFSVAAIGTGITYQWYMDGNAIAGATSNGYIRHAVTAADAGNYSVEVRGTCGTVTSNIATLVVNPSTQIVSAPSNVFTCPGTNAYFSVTATGTSLTYQWKKNGVDIPGATNPNYSISGVTLSDAGSYQVIVSGTCGTVGAAATLNVLAPVWIVTQPANLDKCPGASGNFTVSANGSGPISYQWYKGTNPISGATSNSYSLTNISAIDAGDYSVQVTGACGTVTSNTATLTVNLQTQISTQPTPIVTCLGTPATFSVVASGSNLTYQWYKGSTPLNGATSATYVISSVAGADAGSYTVRVQGTCGPVYSTAASLNVQLPPSISIQPANKSICQGANATFTVLAAGTMLTYAWEVFDGSTWSTITNGGTYNGATTPSLTLVSPSSAYDGYQYRCVLSGACTPAVTSNPATLTVGTAISITTQPVSSQSVCSGSSYTLSVSATGSSPTYQWQTKVGSNWQNLSNGSAYSGVTTPILNVLSATGSPSGIQFRCIVSGTCTPMGMPSSTATVSVHTPPQITVQPVSSHICTGTNTSFSVTAVGTPISYQWQQLIGQTWTDVPYSGVFSGTTGPSLYLTAPNTALNGSQFRCVVTGMGACVSQSISDIVTLNVDLITNITSGPSSQDVCPGETAYFSVGATGTSLTYQWQTQVAGVWSNLTNSSAYSGVGTPTLSVLSTTGSQSGMLFRCIVSGTCGMNQTSGIALLTVKAVQIHLQPSSTTVCAGTDATFQIATNRYWTDYQWQQGVSGTWTNLGNTGVYSGTNTPAMTITGPPASLDGYQYRCVVTGVCNDFETSSPATLTVQTPPFLTVSNVTVPASGGCSATVPLTYSITGTPAPVVTLRIAGNPVSSPQNLPVGQTLVTVDASNTCGTDSKTFTVTVQDVTPPIAITQDVTVQLDASGNGTTTAAAVNNGSSDACGIQSLALSKTDFACTDVGANTVTLTVTDVNGNSSTATATVTVEDNVAPIAVAQNVTVQLDASGNGTTTAAAVNNGSSDACGIQSLVLSKTDFTCADIATNPNTVTLTVTDNNGNPSTTTATVTVEDHVAPIAITQNVTVQLDASGNGATTAAAVNNGSSDACGIHSLALSETNFACADVGANTVTLTVTDVNGNSSTATATVTVEDDVVPIAAAQNVTVQLDASGNGTTTAAAVNNGSSDACGVASLSLSKTAFTCSDIATNPNTVTLTVTDVNGNSSTATAMVTVEDHVAPIAIAQNVTVQLDATGNGTTTAAAVNNGSSDACGIQSLALSKTNFTCADIATNPNTVTLTVTDVNGNFSTTNATVTVQDLVPPVAIAQNVTVQLDASGNGATTAAAVNNGSSDACGIQSLALSKTDFACADVGANTVTLTVTDVNGNSSTATATVTVEDNVAPIAVAQNVTVQLDALGNGTTTAAAVNNGSSDACGIQSLVLSKTAFTCSDIATNPNTVTLTVTDVNGNSSTATAAVTVEDNVDPTASCKNIAVTLDQSGAVSITAGDVDNGSTDACGIQSLTVAPSTFTSSNVGTNAVTLTVTDVNGNTSTCSSTVTVQKRQTLLTYTGELSVQYSDVVSFSATLMDVGTNTALGGKVITFTLGSQSVACTTDVSGAAQITMKIWQQSGSYSIVAAFAGDAIFLGATDTDPFTITKENATVTYSGSPFFSFNSQGSASILFQASVYDALDGAGSEGNVIRSFVDFVNDKSYSALLTHNRPVSLILAADTSAGISASSTIALTQGTGTNYSGEVIEVTPTASGNYYTGAGIMEIVSVAVPGSDFVTGGGYIVLSNSGGAYAGTSNTKSNFGFTMKRNNSGKNLQGQINILFRRLENGVLHTYRIKSNAINNLSTVSVTSIPPLGTGRKAVLSTKANLQDVTDPLNIISIGGNMDLNMEVFESTVTTTGADDQVKITLYGAPSTVPAYTLLYSSNWSSGAPQWQLLGGGKIKVRNPSIPKGGRILDEPVPSAFALYQNYPNPFNPTTTISYDISEDATVRISVCNNIGREVAVLEDTDRPAGRYALVWNGTDEGGADVGSGMYICRMIVTNRSTGTVMQKTISMMLVR